MLRDVAHRIYERLRGGSSRRRPYPVIRNANGADQIVHRKRALIIWVVKAFLTEAGDPSLLDHQNARQCKQVARLLGDFGYTVDVIHIGDRRFRPSQPYDLVISNRSNLHDLGTRAVKNALKIYLATTLYHKTHNQQLRRRHDALRKRRDMDVQVRRKYSERIPYALQSDAIVVFGNEFTADTWRLGYHGPIYPLNNYGFAEAQVRSALTCFSERRKSFLFFASGSQTQKGLDLLLEIFPRHPDLHLYVCSRFEGEEDFRACYARELFETPNVHPVGWIRINGPKFYEIFQKCAYVIHPTCSDGQPGSVVQAMHLGLIPIVTREAGIDTEDFGVALASDTLEEIERTLLEVAREPASWHEGRSRRTRQAAVGKYSEAAFIERWRSILTAVLDTAPIRSGA